MQYFTDTWATWLVIFLVGLAYAWLDKRLRGGSPLDTEGGRRHLPATGLAVLAAVVGGFGLACGLIHFCVSFVVDRLMG